MSLLLTLKYFAPCPSVSIVKFELVIGGWVNVLLTIYFNAFAQRLLQSISKQEILNSVFFRFPCLWNVMVTYSGLSLIPRYLLAQSQKWIHHSNVGNLFKVNNKDARTAPMSLSHHTVMTLIILKRNFAKFTEKHLCQSLFFNKVAGLRPATLLKKRLWQRVHAISFKTAQKFQAMLSFKQNLRY